MDERRALRAFVRCLEGRYGPLADVMAREYAKLVAETWWSARLASEAALVEGAKRRHGRGRRPSLQALDRRMKRQGLGVGTFDALLRRLEEVAGPGRRDRSRALRERLGVLG